jgi:protein-disulfide isomerase
MRSRVFMSAMAGITATGLAFAAPATNSNLTQQQQQQVQQIVHDYLLNNPQILVEMSQKLQQQQMQQMQKIQQKAQQTIPGIASQLFNTTTSPVVGNPKGSVTVVEFFDYQCPHCKDMAGIMDNLTQKDSNVRVIYKEFPIFGANSQYAAKGALAAAQQGKYIEFHNALMQAADPITPDQVNDIAKNLNLNMSQWQKDMGSNAITQELNTNVKLAQQLQLMGTPAFIVSNTANPEQSVLIPGGTTEEVLQGLINQANSGKFDTSTTS